MSAPALRASGVRYSYPGAAPALRGLDLDLGPGLAALVGPNGSAKTTLLRVLAGLLAPSEGSVSLSGRALDDFLADELARHRSYLPQAGQVTFAFTASEVVAMGRHAHSAAADEQAIAEALEWVDAAAFADRAYRELSGGERQRVLIARSLYQCRALMLLDEPTSAQDLHHKHLIFERLSSLARGGQALIVLATHSLALAQQYADEVLVLDGGRLVARGAPAAIIDEGLLRAVFRVEAAALDLPGGGRLLVPVRRAEAGS